LLYAGSCPECLNKGERVVRAIFETRFGAKVEAGVAHFEERAQATSRSEQPKPMG
jgi:hypothetical protein